MNHWVNSVRKQSLTDKICQCIDPLGKQVAEKASHNAKGQPEDDQHNEQKYWYGQIFIGKHIVNPDTADMLTAFFGFDNAVGTELVNKIIPHVSQRRFFIGSKLLLHLGDAVLDHILLIVR